MFGWKEAAAAAAAGGEAHSLANHNTAVAFHPNE